MSMRNSADFPCAQGYGHTDRIFDLAFSPRTRDIIASASGDTTARVWCYRPASDTYHQIACLRGHEAEVLRVGWSPCGKLLATGSADRTVRVWNMDFSQGPGKCSYSATPLAILPPPPLPASPDEGHPEEVYACEFVGSGPSAALLVASSESLYLWDVERGTLLQKADAPGTSCSHLPPDARMRGGNPAYIFSLACQPGGGGLIAAGCSDGVLRLWRLGGEGKGQLKFIADTKVHDKECAITVWEPGGSRIAVGSREGAVAILDHRSLQCLYRFWLPSPAFSAAALLLPRPDGSAAAAAVTTPVIADSAAAETIGKAVAAGMTGTADLAATGTTSAAAAAGTAGTGGSVYPAAADGAGAAVAAVTSAGGADGSSAGSVLAFPCADGLVRLYDCWSRHPSFPVLEMEAHAAYAGSLLTIAISHDHTAFAVAGETCPMPPLSMLRTSATTAGAAMSLPSSLSMHQAHMANSNSVPLPPSLSMLQAPDLSGSACPLPASLSMLQTCEVSGMAPYPWQSSLSTVQPPVVSSTAPYPSQPSLSMLQASSPGPDALSTLPTPLKVLLDLSRPSESEGKPSPTFTPHERLTTAAMKGGVDGRLSVSSVPSSRETTGEISADALASSIKREVGGSSDHVLQVLSTAGLTEVMDASIPMTKDAPTATPLVIRRRTTAAGQFPAVIMPLEMDPMFGECFVELALKKDGWEAGKQVAKSVGRSGKEGSEERDMEVDAHGNDVRMEGDREKDQEDENEEDDRERVEDMDGEDGLEGGIHEPDASSNFFHRAPLFVWRRPI